MSKRVEGGITNFDTGHGVARAEVDFIEFQALNPGDNVEIGAVGTLTIKNVPTISNYSVNNDVLYEDGNNNNARTLRIKSVVGSCKYNIIVV